MKHEAVEMPEQENVDVTVEIPLLSNIRADIQVISYLLPVNGRHL